MQNIESSQDYDNYLKNYIHRYIVTSFKGRGRYDKEYFDNMSSAKKYTYPLYSSTILVIDSLHPCENSSSEVLFPFTEANKERSLEVELS